MSKNRPYKQERTDVPSVIVNNGIARKKWLSWAARLLGRKPQ